MGRVHYQLASRLARIPGIDLISIGWHHQLFVDKWKGWPVYPTRKLSTAGDNAPERDAVGSVLQKENPDILITLGDVWDFSYLSKLNETMRFKWLAYYNIDSGPIKLDLLPNLTSPQYLATTSQFGANVITSVDPSLNPQVIYHGVDTKIFRPLGLGEADRIIVDGPKTKNVVANLANRFVIFMDSQNTHRKNYPIALDAFSRFAKDKKDVFLVIVAKPVGEENGFDLKYSMQYVYSIDRSKAIILENNIQAGIWFPDSYVNYLYNISNVYLSTSRAEGFGLSVLQAMATNTIPACPDYASYPELLADNRGVLTRIAGKDVDFGFRHTALVDVDDLVKNLEELYIDWQTGGHRAKQIHNEGIKFVNQNTWDHSFMNFAAALEKTVAKKKVIHYPNNPYVQKYNDIRAVAARCTNMNNKAKEHIGMVVMGGLGDNIQALPVIKGIARKHPDSHLFLICEANSGIFFDWLYKYPYHPNMDSIELRSISFASILKSLQGVFDYFYDVRYVSCVYDKDGDRAKINPVSMEFFDKNSTFYHQWPWANNVIYHLGHHVVDLRLISCGLQDYASLKDMTLQTRECAKPSGRYVSIHNSAGGVGALKLLPQETIVNVVKYLNGAGVKVIQTGSETDVLIPGTIDLRGRTDYWETAYLLKNAALHIGPEGALYHMNRAVGGRSLVWISATSPEVFVYYNDTNSKVLPFKTSREFECEPCWWKGNDYFHNRCMVGHKSCINLPNSDTIISALREMGI